MTPVNLRTSDWGGHPGSRAQQDPVYLFSSGPRRSFRIPLSQFCPSYCFRLQPYPHSVGRTNGPSYPEYHAAGHSVVHLFKPSQIINGLGSGGYVDSSPPGTSKPGGSLSLSLRLQTCPNCSSTSGSSFLNPLLILTGGTFNSGALRDFHLPPLISFVSFHDGGIGRPFPLCTTATTSVLRHEEICYYTLSSFKHRNKNEIQKSISIESWKPYSFI